MTSELHPDIVDLPPRPFVRALGNLVLIFALCENSLLRLVAAITGNDEFHAVAILKDRNAKDRVLALVHGLALVGYDLEELVGGIEDFWADKEARNRLIHDEWFPILEEPGAISTRGVTRTKNPEIVFGDRTVEEVWTLAKRFEFYRDMFSHRTWAIERNNEAD